MKDTFEAILNASRDLVCLIQESTHIHYASPSHLRLLGYDSDFLMDSSILDFVHSEDKVIFNDYLKGIFKKRNGRGSIEYRMISKKGTELWFQAKASYLHFKGKHCCLIIARDLKSINKQNAILQMTQANLEDAERIAKIGSWRVNMLNWTNWWSKGNFAIYGLDAEKGPIPVKELIKTYLHPDDGSRILDVMKKVIKTGQEIEIRLRIKDSAKGIEGYRHLLTRVRPFYVNGKLVEVKGTNMDINELVKAQFDLEAKNINLQNLNDKLSDYAFKNAHELRGPLSAMLGVIQLMKAENYGALVELLEREALALDDVIKDINTILTEHKELKEGVKSRQE